MSLKRKTRSMTAAEMSAKTKTQTRATTIGEVQRKVTAQFQENQAHRLTIFVLV